MIGWDDWFKKRTNYSSCMIWNKFGVFHSLTRQLFLYFKISFVVNHHKSLYSNRLARFYHCDLIHYIKIKCRTIYFYIRKIIQYWDQLYRIAYTLILQILYSTLKKISICTRIPNNIYLTIFFSVILSAQKRWLINFLQKKLNSTLSITQ